MRSWTVRPCCIIHDGDYHTERGLPSSHLLIEHVFGIPLETVWPGWHGFSKVTRGKRFTASRRGGGPTMVGAGRMPQ